MINALGVLGYGVGGIEAEAVLLGQPLYQPMPRIVGVRLHGELPQGSTATDLVLVVTEMLRAYGVVGAFVEFAGDGLAGLSLADRATISNMSPEFGATSTIFPIDDETLAYLRLTGRTDGADRARRALRAGAGPVARAGRRARLRRRCSSSTSRSVDPVRRRAAPAAGPRPARPPSATTSGRTSRTASRRSTTPASRAADRTAAGRGGVGRVVPGERPAVVRVADATSDAGGRRPPRRRPPASATGRSYRPIAIAVGGQRGDDPDRLGGDRRDHVVHEHLEPDGHGRGRAARPERRRARADASAPTVKTSLAPGSKAVTGYLEAAGLMAPLEALGFALAGYGCTTCIGNSGPLDEPIAQAVEENDLVVAAVLSGNRNFEGRIHPARPGELPRLAAARRRVRARRPGRHRPDSTSRSGRGSRRPAGLSSPTSGRSPTRSGAVIGDVDRPGAVPADVRGRLRGRRSVAGAADPGGRPLRLGSGARRTSPSRRSSTGLTAERARRSATSRARASSRSSATRSRPTTSRRPARSRRRRRPASGSRSTASAPLEFNSYGARRGHHEVMMRGHVRQHPAAQPARRGQGGPVHGPPARRRGAVHLRRRDALPATRACRSSSSPAASTAPARRATGRPRARRCSASGPSSPRATSGSTARTSSGWASCRSSSCPARAPRRSA